MELATLTDKDRGEFNRFVTQHASGNFLQSWDWGDWQEKLGNYSWRFFVQEGEDILLAVQVIETPLTLLKKSYLYIPYGPLLSDSSRQDVLNYFLHELQTKFPQALFVRAEPQQHIAINGRPTIHIQPGKTLLINLKQTEEALLNQMHPKTRYNIKVAKKHEVLVVSEPIITPGYGLHLLEALNLLVQTAGRQGFKSHGPHYYKNLIDFFAMNPSSDCQIAIYKALYQQKLLATALIIDYGLTRTYLFGGTADEQKNVMAPYALHWQAIRDAQNKSLTTYDFWGIETASGKTPGFVRFKLGWGGSAVTYPAPVDVVLRPAWYTVYNVLRSINRKLL